ncbi:MAG TPA: excinuclease ABC subunit UvrC [Bacteroidia bacterium]|nr:excinuclease ABC subunit UvrC [Bacteroidia bacterium]
MSTEEQLRQNIKALPDSPGVYQYFDAEGKLLYVGKAKNLKKRVASYFTKEHDNAKTAILVRRIADIRYIVVDSELDALLLENSLIKKHQPRYNVMLKDDKTYPWICITKERFPRVFHTRKLVRDGSEYFGPYASVKVMYTMLDLVKKMYPLRNCRLVLSEKNIAEKKFRVCLEFHIGNCLGPCEGLQSEEDYNNSIAHIRSILKGNISAVIRQLKELLQDAVAKLEFERAHDLKENIDALETYRGKSTVVPSNITNVDVFTIQSDEKAAYVNFFKVIDGAIVQGHTIEMKKKIEESDEELLQLAIVELRERFSSNAPEVVVPFPVSLEIPGVEFHVPQRGDKRKLIELSERNVEYFRKEQEKRESLTDPERHTKRILATMMKDLRLKEEPRLIECFDNSNFQGDFAVSAMTVFRDARPSKKEYRHFNVKTVEGPDDFATMEEVIFRRYKRVQEENLDMPQLIVIDGGKGQLHAAMNSLEKLGLRGKVAVIGIAKRLEEIYYPGDPVPLYLDKKSETLRIIQHIRDEAHRFGITHHRKKRSKGTIKTGLTEIKGISDATAKKLLSEFKSVKQLKEKSEEEIAAVIGKAKGKLVWEYFRAETGKPGAG